MKIYFDKKFKQWCVEDNVDGHTVAAWGDTREEAIKRFNEI